MNAFNEKQLGTFEKQKIFHTNCSHIPSYRNIQKVIQSISSLFYLFIYKRVKINKQIIDKQVEILPKKLAIRSSVYSCTFSKKIISHGSFHVPEDCQHNLIYCLLCLELLYQRISAFTLHGLSSFWIRFVDINLISAHL